jgi:hypothetical protein
MADAARLQCNSPPRCLTLRQAWKKDAVSPRRYLAIRVRPRQGELLRDGNRVCHFCIVTNRSDPEGSSGLDLIRWHRGKAGTIEHALYNLLSAYKHVGLPEESHAARPKRLRFLLLNKDCPPRPRDPPALHQGDHTSPRRRAANPILPQSPRLN